MTALGPESRRTIAQAVLLKELGREPTLIEVAIALRAPADIPNAVAFADFIRQNLITERIANHLVILGRRLRRLPFGGKLSSIMILPARKLALGMPGRVGALVRAVGGPLYRLLHSIPIPIGVDQSAVNLIPAVDEAVARENAINWCTNCNPTVSIIILNWNAGILTLGCIKNIFANTSGVPYEILIVDNGSSHPDLKCLQDLGKGVQLIELGTNRFFGEANNIAAEAARGEYLCFLNNDAFVHPKWLQVLLKSLRIDPSIGIAGAKLIFPNGRLQEAGGFINEYGVPERRGRFGDPADPEFNQPCDVGYVSAAAALIRRSVFIEVRGFDLAYEPAYYEDVDLCFKLQILGYTVRYCPEAEVTHVEGASTSGPTGIARRAALGDLNRRKFLDRWGEWLKQQSPELAERLRREMMLSDRHIPLPDDIDMLPTATIFTPFMLTPGGGERVILTLAAVLSRTHQVTISTAHPYSKMRLISLGLEFSIDLSKCKLTTYSKNSGQPKSDLWVTLGNHLFPSATSNGTRSFYFCQFPFPMDNALMNSFRKNLSAYDTILTYSKYARNYVVKGLDEQKISRLETKVLYPPVTLHTGSACAKKRIILTVGRFVAEGHTKRHDALIDAFRMLFYSCGGDLEFHIAGSSLPTQRDMEYLSGLEAAAADLPIVFHVNVRRERLLELYSESMFYWHATGYGLVPAEAAERAEHFGITIVEAMSAECVPFAFAAGGPCEIITNGVTGFLFTSLDQLVDRTASLLHSDATQEREAIARAAADTAQRYSLDAFGNQVRHLLSV